MAAWEYLTAMGRPLIKIYHQAIWHERPRVAGGRPGKPMGFAAQLGASIVCCVPPQPTILAVRRRNMAFKVEDVLAGSACQTDWRWRNPRERLEAK